jgi:DNA polymerase-3 subunit alpha
MSTEHKSNFVHLHTHSEYSLTDGAIRIAELVKHAVAEGHPAVALTDHGNLFGAVEFYSKAKDHNIKPIIGSEIYHTGSDPSWALNQSEGRRNQIAHRAFHMVLLAENNDGYQNLVRIVSRGYLDKLSAEIPLVSESCMADNAKNIIALSGSALGEMGFLIRCLSEDTGFEELDFENSAVLEHPTYAALRAHIETMLTRFGRDHYFVELIDNGLPGQAILVRNLAAAASHFGLETVATCNAHYRNEEDREAHVVLTAIKNELTMSDLRDRRRNARFHLLNNQEFAQVYRHYPEAMTNTLRIAERCNVKLTFGKYFLPKFDLGTGEDAEQALTRLAHEGLDARMPRIIAWYKHHWSETKAKEYRDRLDYELSVIIKMGFSGYFLIVQDFINWAKSQDIPVGPGRGSGAGSIVAYALRITDLDPLPFNLIFERFLNPERVSMPDFDIDFCQDRRDEVIRYVTNKYGSNNVAQITTFGKMLAKAALRDVGRVLEIGYSKVDRVAKLIPNELGIKLEDAIRQEPRINEESRKDPMIEDLLHLAQKIEGLNRHTSVHAAGIVISEGGMENMVPVYRGEDGGLITQFEMKNAEKVGLVKFDFLGLKTLTVIHNAVQRIRKKKSPNFDINDIPLDDKKVYDMISDGVSTGVFQLETTGMRKLLPKLRPSNFEDIIALVALFRPGPLQSGMVDDFIERKHGRKKVEYLLPQLEPILKETYGTIVYQEQVQKIAAVLANYSLGEADLLRRAMGKKKPEEMAKQKERFVAGSVSNSINPKLAEELFDMMAKFAEYGFNKSHSAAYGLVSYQTAYLKAHYPEEFMAAIMTCDMDNTDKVVRYIQDCRQLGIKISPPDINQSETSFIVTGPKTISYGLGAIKGLGAVAIEPLLFERRRNGPFQSLAELAKRVNLQKIGKKTIEMLINTGAFDRYGMSRKMLRALIPDLVKYSEDLHAARSAGQGSLFDDVEEKSDSNYDALPSEDQIRSRIELDAFKANYDLSLEKTLLGTYLSRHPIDLFQCDRNVISKYRVLDLPSLLDKGSVLIICLLTDTFERTLKDGKKLRVFRLEDETGEFDPALPSDDLPFALPELETPVVAQIKVTKSYDGNARTRLEKLTPLEVFRRHKVKRVELTLMRDDQNQHDQARNMLSLQKLAKDFRRFAGETPTSFVLRTAKGNINVSTDKLKLNMSNDLIQYLSEAQPEISKFALVSNNQASQANH